MYVPDGPRGFYWDGQGREIEGLNQETWVVVHTGRIKIAFKGLPYPCHILCKEDDLRVALAKSRTEIPRRDSVKAIKEDIT